MKCLLGTALIASLLASPAALAQTTAPVKPKPAPAAAPATTTPSGGTQDKPQPVTKPATATPAGKDSPAGADAKKGAEEASKPGENHKQLEWFAGEWQVVVKDLTPGQESTDEGVMTAKMAYGGRFLQSDFDGRFHGKFFRGGGMMGYNNATKKFESTWADSRDTAISFMTGTMSADNKTLTLTSETTDPVSGKKVVMKEVDKITGKDTYTGEFYMGDTKVMELSYVRGKGAAKKDDAKEESKPKGK